jgi:hypothetical protein
MARAHGIVHVGRALVFTRIFSMILVKIKRAIIAQMSC